MQRFRDVTSIRSPRLLAKAQLMVSQDIVNDEGHHRIRARRIIDKRHDFVRHRNYQISQSSPENFSLPHGLLLDAAIWTRSSALQC